MSHLSTLAAVAAGALLFASCDGDDDVNSSNPDNCSVDGGTLSGGPFAFDVDGAPDFIDTAELSLTGAEGANMVYVITEADSTILGTPADLAAVGATDFDGAGAGTCLIWHLSFEDGLTGATPDSNAADLAGCFDLSNPITVTRNGAVDTTAGGVDTTGVDSTCTVDGGVLPDSSFTFTVDGTPDFVTGVSVTGAVGTNTSYVITDTTLQVLGVPMTDEMLAEVDFDASGAGVCYIWHLSYEDDIEGFEVGANAADLGGCFDLTDTFIRVDRVEP